MSIVPAYNYTLSNFAGYGARRLLSAYAGRGLRGSRRPLGVTAMEYDGRYEALRRAINRNAPAVENSVISKAISTPATSASTTQWVVTDDLIASTDFALKYIGDKFRMHALKLRIRFGEAIHLARVVVYWPKNPGDAITTIDAQIPIDPTTFTVLYDTIILPAHGNQPRKQMLIKTINCKKRTITLDRTGATSGTIKSGELRVTVWCENLTGAAVATNAYLQPIYSNK